MKFLKLALISIVILFCVATAIGLLFPSVVFVSRAIDINAPKDTIQKYVGDINNWHTWIQGMNNKAVEIVSPTKANLAGTWVNIDSSVNYTIFSSWKGKDGTIQQSIIRIIQHDNSPKAVVQWEFAQKVKWYPWERLSSMLTDKITGSMVEKNLSNLKRFIEKSE